VHGLRFELMELERDCTARGHACARRPRTVAKGDRLVVLRSHLLLLLVLLLLLRLLVLLLLRLVLLLLLLLVLVLLLLQLLLTIGGGVVLRETSVRGMWASKVMGHPDARRGLKPTAARCRSGRGACLLLLLLGRVRMVALGASRPLRARGGRESVASFGGDACLRSIGVRARRREGTRPDAE
jgi:hypothetical protein